MTCILFNLFLIFFVQSFSQSEDEPSLCQFGVSPMPPHIRPFLTAFEHLIFGEKVELQDGQLARHQIVIEEIPSSNTLRVKHLTTNGQNLMTKAVNQTFTLTATGRMLFSEVAFRCE